jgi:hypothetical protein
MSSVNVRLPDPESIAKRLAYLYSRRSTVEHLIQSLENYAIWLAKSGELEERKRA